MIKIRAFYILCLFLTNCGTQDGNSKANKEQADAVPADKAAFAALLLGEWRSGCVPVSNQSLKSKAVFSAESTFSLSVTIYTDDGCDFIQERLDAKFKFELERATTQHWEYKSTKIAASMMPNSPTAVAKYERRKTCGKDKWVAGETSENCLSEDSRVEEYSILSLNSDKTELRLGTVIGDLDGSSREKRKAKLAEKSLIRVGSVPDN